MLQLCFPCLYSIKVSYVKDYCWMHSNLRKLLTTFSTTIDYSPLMASSKTCNYLLLRPPSTRNPSLTWFAFMIQQFEALGRRLGCYWLNSEQLGSVNSLSGQLQEQVHVVAAVWTRLMLHF